MYVCNHIAIHHSCIYTLPPLAQIGVGVGFPNIKVEKYNQDYYLFKLVFGYSLAFFNYDVKKTYLFAASTTWLQYIDCVGTPLVTLYPNENGRLTMTPWNRNDETRSRKRVE